jgi:uncharacterized protein (DUF2235 family)
MTRNIVICSDGTGNSFKRHESNVARLVPLLSLIDHRAQVVVYDQGIGTDARRWREIEAFRATIRDREALEVLRGPHESRFRPAEWGTLVLGLAFGYGLAENVRQMYQALASRYEPGDRVFLFGFSRGAFTVRALAGLLYRCGLPVRDRHADNSIFRRAWALYQPMHPDLDAIAAFRAGEQQRDCPIHFLGIWDTVKSYGGLRPVMLPHLRHNPIVSCVRHAVALDEQRGWFDVTTWGRLDLDREPDAAWSRLPEAVRATIAEQDIDEVWFRGCHSDVGGGNGDEQTERIALRWMLAEAAAQEIALSDAGRSLLAPSNSPEQAEVHDSHTATWRAVERVPRRVIDNSGTWPRRIWADTPNARRDPLKLTRGGVVSVHESVGTLHGIPPEVRATSAVRGGRHRAADS